MDHEAVETGKGLIFGGNGIPQAERCHHSEVTWGRPVHGPVSCQSSCRTSDGEVRSWSHIRMKLHPKRVRQLAVHQKWQRSFASGRPIGIMAHSHSRPLWGRLREWLSGTPWGCLTLVDGQKMALFWWKCGETKK